MLQSQFILQNAHFTLSLLAAFVFFAMFWLYFYAWKSRKNVEDGLKLFGLLLISLSYVVHAVFVEQILLQNPLFGTETVRLVSTLLKIGGFLALIAGLILSPLQKRPSFSQVAFLSPNSTLGTFSLFLSLLSALAGFLYIRRATRGLEHHLKTVGFAFFILSLSELASLASEFRNTNNINLYTLVAPFGLLWVAEHALLFIAILVMGIWVFQYLLTKIQTQLFIFFTSFILIIFLLSTVSITTLILTNVQNETLRHLSIDVKVLRFAIDSKKAETLSDAQLVAQNAEIQKAVLEDNRKSLRELTSSILFTKRQAFLIVVSSKGRVLMRAEDPERINDSLSDDILVRRALEGEHLSSVLLKDHLVAPNVSIRSAAPIKAGEDTIGVVIIGSSIDNAFLDAFKDATGLNVAVYANTVLSATTFIASDGKSRLVGIKEEHPEIKKRVLGEGGTYVGIHSILNAPYLAAFGPLVDHDKNPVGMLFVGLEQHNVLQIASRLIEATFIVACVLLVISIIPAYFIARYIAYQIR